GFVLPTGYSFNLDGSTLYLSLASVFVAQIAGVQMTIGQQLVMMLTLMLTSKGVAGVPRAALVVLTATLTQFNLPLEGAAILLGNCAAYNDVDGAEDHPIEALNANAFAVRALARAAERLGATLVHYSTDFVFDGTAVRPYSEADRPNPRSVYATSKLLGDWFAFDAPRAYVLRVESLFGRAPNGPEPRGSVASILNRLMAGESPKVFIDRTISPTYVVDAARATRELVERAAPAGLYHCVNTGECTWFEFARELAHRLGLEAALTPVRTTQVALRAARPLYRALSHGQ